jgi:integral membrane protein
LSWLSDPLHRYRIMAWVVGTMLIAVFVCLIPAINKVDGVLGPIHGVLYIVYLATVVNMLLVYRINFWYFVGMVVAGWCPFVSFAVERLITRRIERGAAGYSRRPTFESDLEP